MKAKRQSCPGNFEKIIKEVFPGKPKTAPGANDTLTDEAALKIIQKISETRKRFCQESNIGQGRQEFS